MENIKKFDDFLDRMIGLLDNAKKQGHIIVRVEDLENTFPELKESEDEKIRKWLIDTIKSVPNDSIEWDVINKSDVLAWLEKQGEQKSVWSEEDERNLKGIIDEIEANKNNAPDYDLATYDRFLSWLKSIKERVQPQNTWKPSEGQMGVIEAVINNRSFQRRHLDSLYNDLKKLKG